MSHIVGHEPHRGTWATCRQEAPRGSRVVERGQGPGGSEVGSRPWRTGVNKFPFSSCWPKATLEAGKGCVLSIKVSPTFSALSSCAHPGHVFCQQDLCGIWRVKEQSLWRKTWNTWHLRISPLPCLWNYREECQPLNTRPTCKSTFSSWLWFGDQHDSNTPQRWLVSLQVTRIMRHSYTLFLTPFIPALPRRVQTLINTPHKVARIIIPVSSLRNWVIISCDPQATGWVSARARDQIPDSQLPGHWPGLTPTAGLSSVKLLAFTWS